MQSFQLQVAELLLVRGLAQIVHHRTDDERSAHYESLMKAEASGKSNKKGLHNKNRELPAHHYNDVSVPGMASKAKQYLPFFQRGKHSAVVEFVSSGHRLKVCRKAILYNDLVTFYNIYMYTIYINVDHSVVVEFVSSGAPPQGMAEYLF